MSNSEITKLVGPTDTGAVPAINLYLRADTILQMTARLWFVAAVIGQWMFVAFIVSFYGGAAISGDFERWNKITEKAGIGNEIPHGYVTGDLIGNLMVGMHLLMAAIIIFGLPLQLIPQIRNQAPAFHRWNGRAILISGFVILGAGLYLIFARGSVSGAYFMAGNIINAGLIALSGVMALRYALIRDFGAHYRWALRLFVLVNGVWFMRIGFFFWFMINGGSVGHNKTFTGPFDIFIAFAHTLLPVLILEIYLRIKKRGTVTGKLATAISLFFITLAMGAGTFGISAAIWIPNL